MAMATKDTGGQSQSSRSRQESEIDETPAPEANPDVQARHEELTEEVDDLLDEIDATLESNASEFVRSFVQKGGQ